MSHLIQERRFELSASALTRHLIQNTVSPLWVETSGHGILSLSVQWRPSGAGRSWWPGSTRGRFYPRSPLLSYPYREKGHVLAATRWYNTFSSDSVRERWQMVWGLTCCSGSSHIRIQQQDVCTYGGFYHRWSGWYCCQNDIKLVRRTLCFLLIEQTVLRMPGKMRTYQNPSPLQVAILFESLWLHDIQNIPFLPCWRKTDRCHCRHDISEFTI